MRSSGELLRDVKKGNIDPVYFLLGGDYYLQNLIINEISKTIFKDDLPPAMQQHLHDVDNQRYEQYKQISQEWALENHIKEKAQQTKQDPQKIREEMLQILIGIYISSL